MKSYRPRLMAMICLLAVSPTSSATFAQDAKMAMKPRVPIEVSLLPAGTFKVFGAKYFGKVVKGAPYSATAVTEHVQTLGDGNKIIRTSEAKVYRDSEGRTRLDQKLETIGKWTAADHAPQMSYIHDPVKGVSYNLNPNTRTVIKSSTFNYAPVNQNRHLTEEKRLRAQEERIREQEKRVREHEERVKEQAREREMRARENEERARERSREFETRAKERAKEFEAQARERAREHEARARELETRMKERNREHETRMRELKREHELRLKEHETRVKEHAREHESRMKESRRVQELRMKERTKEHERRLKEHTKEHEKRVKEHEKRVREHQERRKLIERQRDRQGQLKEPTISPKSPLKPKAPTVSREASKSKEATGSKEIINSKEPAIAKEITSSKESSHTKEITSSKESTISKEARNSNEPAKSKEITNSKESVKSKEITRSEGRKKIETLGKQTIEGLEVEGSRSIRAIPAGEIGNTLPIEIVDESWYSADLQVQVMTRYSDPRSGVTTYRLSNIRRSEPERSLFEVPADYISVVTKVRTRVEPILKETVIKSTPVKKIMPTPRKAEPVKKFDSPVIKNELYPEF
jgi:hypothetical protein